MHSFVIAVQQAGLFRSSRSEKSRPPKDPKDPAYVDTAKSTNARHKAWLFSFTMLS